MLVDWLVTRQPAALPPFSVTTAVKDWIVAEAPAERSGAFGLDKNTLLPSKWYGRRLKE